MPDQPGQRQKAPGPIHILAAATITAEGVDRREATGRRASVEYEFYRAPCSCCMFLAIAASDTRNSSLGLNCTNSLLAAAAGTWPGGR
jgi:hypothetical protein